MTNTLNLTTTTNYNQLFLNQCPATLVFNLIAEENHSHQSQNSVSTIETYINQITLQDRVGKKDKKIVKEKAKAKKAAPAFWSKQELNTFVELLKTYGSDFTLIATKITKTREQIKRKFKVLQKKYPTLANAIFQRSTNNLMEVIYENEFVNEQN